MTKREDSRRGVFIPVLPLDVLILRTLPKEGTFFMGVYPEASQIKDIVKVVGDGKLPSSLVSTRLRVLHMFEYATSVKVPRSSTAGWQITPKGEQLVADNPVPDQESHDVQYQQ